MKTFLAIALTITALTSTTPRPATAENHALRTELKDGGGAEPECPPTICGKGF
jgi:hypothetical protein